ncbi:cytochrome c [Vibrio sp. 10N.261.46.E12]|uniref:c-type cytochrome n=1 Tax=unclassified Vibrio TaxID=2614977 RepID=UPI0009768CC3|nr:MULTISPECIES: cytochrome c [unclassified Vibrio]OMO34839.1 cytochrome C554 [Vibrio sp. 10N.261.45.E1]PMJ24295.1 cytochrome C554 [Vibrio sp. 10N.286.45.B6]PML85652.1 cytochrome C554 [Vibrio sp. 10N.261.49.E11]PMM66147.1 cytochrome C554 [Vibrio sp. 10N.261.46.F12]PMM81955.1 cytochrome C554 [Vibrio sp. 10N.261.46.E8]
MSYQSLTLILLALSPGLQASDFGDPELGKMKSPSCVFCHTPTSTSINNSYPILSGQDPIYLFNTMKAYQNGDRQGDYAEMMRTQLSKLNHQDLKDIAAFYASQR